MNSICDFSETRQEKHPASLRLFGPAILARLGGDDVFMIVRLPDGVKVKPDGTVLSGQHRLRAFFDTLSKFAHQPTTPLHEMMIPKTIPTQQSTGDQENYIELVDFSILVGQDCWKIYRRSNVGFVRLLLLPSDEARCQARILFQLGFSGCMTIGPTPGKPSSALEEPVWKSYLASAKGKVVLDGPAYPDTPKNTLDSAKEFFLEGFRAGTFTIREFFHL